jgi:hypothetical protein
MATLTFFKNAKIIEVDSPQTNVTVQDLVNQIRDYEDNLCCAMDILQLANATGKDCLGGCPTVQTGITLTLLNDWRVRFEDRPGPCTVQVSVSGGNLVAVNAFCNNPIAPSTFTQVTVESSVSASIIGSADQNMRFLLESNNPHHTGYGDIIYWDPTNGCDGLPGTSVSCPVATFAQAQTLATCGGHDVIFALAADSCADTVVTENIVISKSWLFLRGPGRHFQIKPTSGIPISVTARGVEVSKMVVSGACATGCNATIQTTGSFTLLKDLVVQCATAQGILVCGANEAIIDNVIVKNATTIGVDINCSSDVSIENSTVIGNTTNGIDVAGACSSELMIKNTIGQENCGYQVVVGSGVVGAVIGPDSMFEASGTGRICDSGTRTKDGEVEFKTNFAKKVHSNRQIITSNQLIIYDDDDVTPLLTFNLQDSGGSPTENNPVRKVPV